jgi:beta-lactamase regulating signal transducer with metallopeptidase domain
MNALPELLDAAAQIWFAHAMAMLWQVTLVVVVLALVDRWLADRVRAVVRYALWMLVLVKLVLPPALSLPTSPAYWLTMSPSVVPAPVTATSLNRLDLVDGDAPLLSGSEPPNSLAAPRTSPATWAFLTWLAGCALGTGLLLTRSARMHRLLRTLPRHPIPHAELAPALTEAARTLGVRRPPRLLLTDVLPGPSVAGLLRTAVILPAGLPTTLTTTQLRGVLLHELAHVRRRDLWINAAQAWLQVLYWWHPAVWYANARLRLVREEATDETVVAALAGGNESYAETLVHVARNLVQRRTFVLGMLGILESRQALRSRIERILNCQAGALAGARLGKAGWRACVALGLALLPLASRPGLSEVLAQQPILVAAPATSPYQTADDLRADPAFRQVVTALERAPGQSPGPAGTSPSAKPSPDPAHGSPVLPAELANLPVPTTGLQDVTLPDALILLNRALQGVQQPLTIQIKAPQLRQGHATSPSVRRARQELFDLQLQVPAGTGTLPLSQLLDAMVLHASQPIHYTYHPELQTVVFEPVRQLFTRVFRLDPGSLPGALTRFSREDDPAAPLPQRVRDLVEKVAGVSLLPPNGVFFNENTGQLMVRATGPEIEQVELLFEELLRALQQVLLEAKFVEVDTETAQALALDTLGRQRPRPNLDPVGILTDAQFRILIRALEQRSGIHVFATPRILTLAGRAASIETSPTKAEPGERGHPGVQIEMVAELAPDGVTWQLQAKASLTYLVNLDENTPLTTTPSGRPAAKSEPEHDLDRTKAAAASAEPAPTPGRVHSVRTQGYVIATAKSVARLFDGQTAVMEVAIPDLPGLSTDPQRYAGKRHFVFLTPVLVDPAGNQVHVAAPDKSWPPTVVPEQ